ncbi:MAG TPA: UDP-glucose 4-epimerase [Paraburkholderia sp.]|nr:UDP-glucose 4-epimerase [Paraburkholderia sp.]
MTLKGNISEGHWNVVVETTHAASGGYRCTVHVMHELPGHNAFNHTFTHHRTFSTEHDAVLEGLREGMTWIELKRTNAFDV